MDVINDDIYDSDLERSIGSFKHNYKKTIFLSRDFLDNVAGALIITNVTASHVFQHKNNNRKVLPATIWLEPTLEQRLLTLEYMRELKCKIQMIARDRIENIMVTYASNVLKWEHLDGQPISTYRDMRVRADWKTKFGTDSEKKEIWQMVFDGGFPKNWEHMEEMSIMKKENLDYRPWITETLVKKGFVARIMTKELNIKRKDFKGCKRRTDAEHDQDGKTIRRRNKHRIEYNPDAHFKKIR